MKIAPASLTSQNLLLISLSPMVLIHPGTIVIEAAPMSDNVIASYFEPYPDCNVDTSNIPWFMRHPGDGRCAYELNIPECGFDGGDCDDFNEKWPDCKPIVGAPFDHRRNFVFGQPGSYWYDPNQKVELWHEMLNNSICDAFLNTEGCGYDGGDCIEFNENYPGCKASAPSWIGDGGCDDSPFWWDSSYNTEECGFDGGDCVEVATDEESTIEPTPTIEPTEESTIDGTGLASEEVSEPWDEEMRAKYPNCTVIDATKIGNGRCDGAYMTEECGWDGGDCLILHELYPDCVPDETSAQWKLFEEWGLNIHLFWPDSLKDGECDGYVNTAECGFDDGDCLEYNEKYPDCKSPMPHWVGNGFCACLPENNDGEYSEECGWDGGDCEGVEELCEGTIEPSPTEEPPVDDTEEAFSDPSGGTASKSFEGLFWIVPTLAYAIGI